MREHLPGHTKIYRSLLVFLLLWGIFQVLSMGVVLAQEQEQEQHYISQTYVDTMVLQAFVDFSQAMSVGGVGFRQKQAIENARRVALKLRRMARGDPNEKYVLWKVSELEAQIWYEEQDLLLQEKRTRLEIQNRLIDEFNQLLAAKRPGFAALYGVHGKMKVVDENKAEELRYSIAHRDRQISREVEKIIKSGIESGQFSKVRGELEYCRRNKGYLSVSEDYLSQANAIIHERVDAATKKQYVQNDITRANRLLAQKKLDECYETVMGAHEILQSINGKIPKTEYKTFSVKLSRVSSRIEFLEDSLVNHCLELIMRQGSDRGYAFLENTLREYGVSQSKLGIVSYTLMQVSLDDSRGGDSAIGAGIDSLVNSAHHSSFVVGDLQTAARRKAQARADSIRAAALAQEQDSRSREQTGLFARIRQRRKARHLARQKAHQHSAPAGTQSTADALRQEVVFHPQQQPADATADSAEKARTMISDIYGYLENDRIRTAWNTFRENRDLLKDQTGHQAFAVLESTVTQAWEQLQFMQKSVR